MSEYWLTWEGRGAVSGPDETNWGKVGAIAAVVSVIVAIVAIVIAHQDSNAGTSGPTPPGISTGSISTSLPATDAGPRSATSSPSYINTQSTPRPSVQVQSEEPSTPPKTGIEAVYVTVGSGNGLILKKGDVFELQPTYPSDINPPYMTFRWASQGPGGEVDSDDCTVSATISGPGEYPQHRRDGACSGRVSTDLKIMEPGVYTVSVDVTPPGGGTPVPGSASFTVVPHGG